MYFAGDPLNDIDRLLLSVPESERDMFVVDFRASPEGSLRSGNFDIVLSKV